MTATAPSYLSILPLTIARCPTLQLHGVTVAESPTFGPFCLVHIFPSPRLACAIPGGYTNTEL